uniref:Uncharacterized protein n=1 Tax=Anguilla anguilla TaxID=7936 RepID=A0A0E9U2C8_ANGAN
MTSLNLKKTTAPDNS